MSSNEGGLDKAKLFSSKELEIATDQFNENRILGYAGQGMVYKGMLPDGKIVAVKKSKTVVAWRPKCPSLFISSSLMEPFAISFMTQIKSTRGCGIFNYTLQWRLRVQFLTCTHLHPPPFIIEISSLVTYH
ncbi:hypothetical protein Goshw_026893 [Gossypium schwendimanii]|uniref:Protein kinase domain-containing protein n=1 Tax=Gossypium schwendimanii TaxID=34291 RepID=A0A7J9MKW3_GOSSC|nr:hypothetical protein [Gossypium schwendimanii]